MPDSNMVKQACDACRRRKVRCNNDRPCNQCQSASLACHSSLKRKKKGRQGNSANILNELRAKETQGDASISLLPQNPQADLSHPKRTPSFTRSSGLVNPGLVRSCSEYFFSRMRGTVPILHPDSLQKHIDNVNSCLHTYCLVTAFCAFVVTQTGYRMDPNAIDGHKFSQEEYRAMLIEEATEARKHLDPFADPVKRTIITAFLLYGCHIGLGNQRHAYYYLREATTLFTASALDGQASNETDDEDLSADNKLFWLLLVSERAHAIRRHRPITLRISSETQELEDPQSNMDVGFRCLVDLYRPFDERFLAEWNGDHATCSIDSLVRLEERIQNAVPADIDLPDVLMADLRVSQQWLRIMIWQLSTTAGFLSTAPTHECMDFRYPLLIARDLCLATWKLSKQSMQTHGIGLIEKIFEVACTLIDVMACLSSAGLRSSGFKLGPQDYLKHFFTLIHDLPGGRVRFLPLLLTKIGQNLPSMVDAITAHLNLNPSIMREETSSQPGLSLAPASINLSPSQSNPISEPFSDDWAYSQFNYAEMSRIGDKTPEIDEAFLQYSSYFP
ncbi:uncharacterized protein N7469_000480 [Penicillium citrinum]|uniref:Zn(2)-C6 fungal-type domain-containing protein n=1 Tax=Penicillium citrinum TaxID=5077 RepID=A0A9W9TUX8_PENCI|nr:uncharacterized protein N7469_000480 [Penicillium citrinum]KAJ5242153.1 hypothetical protein N7469_000480 [Penicillium citrinum]